MSLLDDYILRVRVRVRELEQEVCQDAEKEANITAKKELVKKTMYELHKRLSKLQRRCKQNSEEDCIDLESNYDSTRFLVLRSIGWLKGFRKSCTVTRGHYRKV